LLGVLAWLRVEAGGSTLIGELRLDGFLTEVPGSWLGGFNVLEKLPGSSFIIESGGCGWLRALVVSERAR